MASKKMKTLSQVLQAVQMGVKQADDNFGLYQKLQENQKTKKLKDKLLEAQISDLEGRPERELAKLQAKSDQKNREKEQEIWDKSVSNIGQVANLYKQVDEYFDALSHTVGRDYLSRHIPNTEANKYWILAENMKGRIIGKFSEADNLGKTYGLLKYFDKKLNVKTKEGVDAAREALQSQLKNIVSSEADKAGMSGQQGQEFFNQSLQNQFGDPKQSNENERESSIEEPTFATPEERFLYQSLSSENQPPDTIKKKEQPKTTTPIGGDEDNRPTQFWSGGKFSDLVKSVPSSIFETAEGITGLLGAKELKQQIREGKEGYEKGIGIADRNAVWAVGGRLLGDLITPYGAAKLAKKILPAAKLAKTLGFAEKIPKTLKYIGTGGAYGAIQSEAQDGNPLVGAATGAALNTGIGYLGRKLSPKMGKLYEEIKERATHSSAKEIAKRASVMGKEALIPELVGDETLINTIKKNTSKKNIKRMQKIESKVKKGSQEIIDDLPGGEPIELYKDVKLAAANAGETKNQLYEKAFEEGIGEGGHLPKNVITDWIKAIKTVQSSSRYKFPTIKEGVKNQKVFSLIEQAPDDPIAFEKFVRKHSDELPLAADFRKFRSKIKQALGKADANNLEPLKQMENAVENILEKYDTTALLKKADHYNAVSYAPFQQKPIQEAMSSAALSKGQAGRPSVSATFGKQSTSNALVFEQLPSPSKLQIIGEIIEEALKEGEKHPARAIHEAWKKLPTYIRESSDPFVKKYIDEIENIAHINKTLSSLQRSTTSDIGSRLDVQKLEKIFKAATYAHAAATGDVTLAGLTAGGRVANETITKALNKSQLKKLSQKNLPYYMNPKLLKEMEQKKARRVKQYLEKPISKLSTKQFRSMKEALEEEDY